MGLGHNRLLKGTPNSDHDVLSMWKSNDLVGLSTVWAQQRDYITKALLASDTTQEEIDNIDPRDQTTRDLDKFVEAKQWDCGKVLIMWDLNQDIYSNQRGVMSHGKMCKKQGLFSAMYHHEENLKLSHAFGSKVIDHISIGGSATEEVIGTG